jgi:hypothetical protein
MAQLANFVGLLDRCWHLASFRRYAEFGRLSAHIGRRVVIKLD